MLVLKWGTCGFLVPCLCDLPREIGACSDLCKEKKESKTYTIQVQLGHGLGSSSEPVLLLAQSQIIRWTLWYSDVQPWGQSVLNFHLVQDVHLDDICLPLQVLTNFVTLVFFSVCILIWLMSSSLIIEAFWKKLVFKNLLALPYEPEPWSLCPLTECWCVSPSCSKANDTNVLFQILWRGCEKVLLLNSLWSFVQCIHPMQQSCCCILFIYLFFPNLACAPFALLAHFWATCLYERNRLGSSLVANYIK